MKAKERTLEAMQDGEYWNSKKLSEKLGISSNCAAQILIRLADIGSIERRQTLGNRFEYRIVPEGSLPQVGRVRLFDMYLRGGRLSD